MKLSYKIRSGHICSDVLHFRTGFGTKKTKKIISQLDSRNTTLSVSFDNLKDYKTMQVLSRRFSPRLGCRQRKVLFLFRFNKRFTIELFRILEVGRSLFNPFTPRAPPEPNVCYFHTFENNLRTKQKFPKYLKESCSLASDKPFSFICFPENAFVSNIFPNLSSLFWLI